MGTFQTLLSIVLLIFILSVVVQAVQELVKAVLNTKANVMEQMLEKFMGDGLKLPQVQRALKDRGLKITDLENLNTDGFRHLLDGIPFQIAQLQGIVASAGASLDQIKDNIAASYDAARAAFQAEYTRRNKLYAFILSLLVVIVLNSNVVILYEQLSSDQVAQQAIVGKAVAVTADQPENSGNAQAQPTDLAAAYSCGC
jgi:hypothetical protein